MKTRSENLTTEGTEATERTVYKGLLLTFSFSVISVPSVVKALDL